MKLRTDGRRVFQEDARHVNLVLAEKIITEDDILSADFVRRDNL